MPKIYYHHQDGSVDERVVDDGATVMRAAVTGGVRGVVGECGGNLMCATCHVYVHAPYISELQPISDDEEEMLEATASPRDPIRSRLSCQLILGEGLDELHIDVPESQV